MRQNLEITKSPFGAGCPIAAGLGLLIQLRIVHVNACMHASICMHIAILIHAANPTRAISPYLEYAATSWSLYKAAIARFRAKGRQMGKRSACLEGYKRAHDAKMLSI